MADTRVAHIIESAAMEAGSIALALRGLDHALAARGVDVECQALSTPSAASQSRQTIEQLIHHADVVHLFGWGTLRLARAARIALRANKPLIVSPFGMLTAAGPPQKAWPQRARDWLSDRRILRQASAITAINEFEKHALSTRYATVTPAILTSGICRDDATPVHVGRPRAASANRKGSLEQATSVATMAPAAAAPALEAADPALTSEARASVAQSLAAMSPGAVLLVLGPVHPAEGLVPLLKAFAELGTSAGGWNVVMAGPQPGPWRKQLEAAVERKGAADRVCFADASTLEMQSAWLARADALACTPLGPRCPISILQGLAAGVPVIASHHVVPSGVENAVRVCAPTKAEIRHALKDVLTLAEADRRARADVACEIVAPLIDWKTVADSYTSLYERVC